MEKKLKTTQIKDPNSKFFIKVVLYPDGHRFRGYQAQYNPNTYIIYPKRKIKPKLGTIKLSADKLGCGLISHEVFHATMDYVNKKYNTKSLKTDNDDRQEDAAYFHGYMVKEIINWLNDNKLW